MTHSRITLKLKASRLHSGRGKEVCFQGKGGGGLFKKFCGKNVCSENFCGIIRLLQKILRV